MVEALGGLFLASVLLVFILLKREDLRNRLIRLVGNGRITATTKALDDAAQRVSRYLLMQLIVNSTFGLAITLGLLAIGVEHAILWGFMGATLRYVPYVGAWIAALGPVLLSLAMFPGWVQPLLVVGLFGAIELLTGNVIEPRLYGRSIGVSEIALLVAAAFWAFLWGPVGLVLRARLPSVWSCWVNTFRTWDSSTCSWAMSRFWRQIWHTTSDCWRTIKMRRQNSSTPRSRHPPASRSMTSFWCLR